MTSRPDHVGANGFSSRVLFLSVIGAALATVAVLQISVRRQYETQQQAAKRVVEQDSDAARDVNEKIGQWYRKTDADVAPSAEELRNIVGSAQPLEPIIDQDSGNTAYRMIDPTTGGQVRIVVHSPTLVRAWPERKEWNLANPNKGLHGAVMIGRRLVIIGLYGLWGILLILFLLTFSQAAAPARMRDLKQMLAVALAATFLAFLGPQYWRAWANFLQDDSPGWGYVATTVTLVLMIVCARRDQHAQAAPACRQCGYNLTGNVSGVCPECGARIAQTPAV